MTLSGNIKQIQNIVFSEKNGGVFGNEGFYETFNKKTVNKKIKISYKDPSYPILDIKNIKNHSIKFFNILDNILHSDGIIFIFFLNIFGLV